MGYFAIKRIHLYKDEAGQNLHLPDILESSEIYLPTENSTRPNFPFVMVNKQDIREL